MTTPNPNDLTLEQVAAKAASRLKVGYHGEGLTRWDCVPSQIILEALRQVALAHERRGMLKAADLIDAHVYGKADEHIPDDKELNRMSREAMKKRREVLRDILKDEGENTV